MALYEDTSVAAPPAVSAALGQLSVPSGHPFMGAGVPFPAYQPSPGQRVAAVLQQLLATPVPHRAAPHDLPLVAQHVRPAPHDLPLVSHPLQAPQLVSEHGGGGMSPALANLIASLRNLPPGPQVVGGHLRYY